MRLHLRVVLALASALASGTSLAADSTYLQIRGVNGPSTGTGYTGWFDVAQDNVVLLPAVLGSDGKTVITQCTATVRTQLGAAGAAVAQLVGATLGNVRLERVSPLNSAPIYRAVLRNAVLTQESTTFDAGGAYDTLFLRFEDLEVVTFQQKADGSLGSGVQGSFNCMLVP